MQGFNDNHVLISMQDAVRATSLSRTMINNLRTAGRFPVPVPLGERRFAFVKAEVEAWIAERVAARRAA